MTKNLIYWYKEEDVFEALRERILTKDVQELFDNTGEYKVLIQAFAELTYSEEFIVFGKIYYSRKE